MKELLGYQVDEVAAALRMPTRLIECLCPKSLNFWEVKANINGRPINSGAMYPHAEFLIMKAMFKHLEKMQQNLRRQCSKTMDYGSYIFMPSSAVQQCEMTTFKDLWRT